MSISDDLKLKRSSSATRRGRGFAEFISIKNEIEDALMEGFNVIEIWELLTEQGKVSVGYNTFAQYVRKGIGGRSKQLSKDTESAKPDNRLKKTIPGFDSEFKRKPLHDPDSSRVAHLMVSTKQKDTQE